MARSQLDHLRGDPRDFNRSRVQVRGRDAGGMSGEVDAFVPRLPGARPSDPSLTARRAKRSTYENKFSIEVDDVMIRRGKTRVPECLLGHATL